MDTEASLVGGVRKHVVGVGVVGASCSGEGRAGKVDLGPYQLSLGDWVALALARCLCFPDVRGHS